MANHGRSGASVGQWAELEYIGFFFSTDTLVQEGSATSRGLIEPNKDQARHQCNTVVWADSFKNDHVCGKVRVIKSMTVQGSD